MVRMRLALFAVSASGTYGLGGPRRGKLVKIGAKVVNDLKKGP